MAGQTQHVLANLQMAIEAAGGTAGDICKITIFVVGLDEVGYEGSTGSFSPHVECCSEHKPGWVVYAESRGGHITIDINDEAYTSFTEMPCCDATTGGNFMSTETTLVRCERCGARNRIPVHRLNDRPVCGKCKTPLSMPSFDSHPVEVTDRTFRDEVLSFRGPVLVDCWAPWCGPCRMVGPVLDQLASEYAGRIKIAKLNVDENPMTSSQYAIQSIPTMLVFKNGQQVNRLVGALPKNEIKRHLLPLL